VQAKEKYCMITKGNAEQSPSDQAGESFDKLREGPVEALDDAPFALRQAQGERNKSAFPKKYTWLKKPIFWSLLISSFDFFFAFYFFMMPFFHYVDHTQYIYYFKPLGNSIVDFWLFLNHPILIFTGPVFTRVLKFGPHTSPFAFLFYNLLIAVLLFSLVHIAFYIFKTAKKRKWFDKPVFFGLLFSVFEFVYTFLFIAMWIVDYSDPNQRERIDFMVSTGRELPLFYSVLSGLLSFVLLFIIGYILGYIVKIIRKRIYAS
jgi:hypothetical protein